MVKCFWVSICLMLLVSGCGGGSSGGATSSSSSVASSSSSDTASSSSSVGGSASITLAAGGDWDDKFLPGERTEVSLKAAGQHDALLMLGDLSYAGIENNFANNIANASSWCNKVNPLTGKPILFVAGDHDSKRQDGDIATYADCLNPATGIVGTPTGVNPKGGAYVGKYPYLYYSDIVKQGVKIRVVGTSIAYEETPTEPAEYQKYLLDYQAGGDNYKWLSDVYADAKSKGYWLVHINHLPCIDMGKNKSFKGCQDIIDLDAASGVNLMMSGSSHNVWRTKALGHKAGCSSVELTTSPTGANPACAYDNETSSYYESDGFVNVHNGAAGKSSASSGPNCDINADGEVRHYARSGACYINGTPGIISLTFTEQAITGKFLASAAVSPTVDLSRYDFSIQKGARPGGSVASSSSSSSTSSSSSSAASSSSSSSSAPACTPSTGAVSSIWNTYDGSKLPEACNSVTLSSGVGSAFVYKSGNLGASYVPFLWDGTVARLSTVGAPWIAADRYLTQISPLLSNYSMNGGVTPPSYPRHYTLIGRVKGNGGGARVIEFDHNFGHGVAGSSAQNGARVKLVVDTNKVTLANWNRAPVPSNWSSDVIDTTTTAHTYQVSVYLATESTGIVRVYQDGVLLIDTSQVNAATVSAGGVQSLTVNVSSSNKDNSLSIGDNSPGSAYDSNISWLIWSEKTCSSTLPCAPADFAGLLPAVATGAGVPYQ